jgi:hypothetical protein
LDGPAFIKREGWNSFYPIGFGALVYSTDLLETEGEITLLCADLQTIRTFHGRGRNPCPLSKTGSVLSYDDMLFSPGMRGSTASSIPALVSPRNTTVLDTHLLLRWQDTGSSSYTVAIIQGSETVWTAKDVIDTEITYPANAPALSAGKDYLLVVTDHTTGRSSAEEKEKGLGFQIVNERERSEIETQQQALLNLSGLDEPAQKLALAMYYTNLRIGGRGLWNDALVLLEETARDKPNEPVIFLRQGDILAKMKLWHEAVTAYKKACDQAEKNGDLETQAALWRIDPSDQTQFDRALSIYEQIGAKDKADNLRQESAP